MPTSSRASIWRLISLDSIVCGSHDCSPNHVLWSKFPASLRISKASARIFRSSKLYRKTKNARYQEFRGSVLFDGNLILARTSIQLQVPSNPKRSLPLAVTTEPPALQYNHTRTGYFLMNNKNMPNLQFSLSDIADASHAKL